MRGTKPSAVIGDRAALAKAPTAPVWLARDAKAEWRRIMPLLIERRILTDADMGGVENYCVAIGRTRQIERELAVADTIDPRLFRMQMASIQTARQLAAELGLTPVSRSRPSIREDSDESDFADLDL